MEEEVRISKATYDAMQHTIKTKDEKIKQLEEDLSKTRHDHEEEIEKMAKEGKVRVMTYTRPLFFSLFCKEEIPVKTFKGFDDVKQEVEQHFKEGLFKEELDKKRNELEDSYKKKVEEKDKEIEALMSRSLWKRIINKK